MSLREPLKTGTTLAGEYRIDQVLGAGGFGITYLARDLSLDQEVAIKEYFPAEFGVRDASHSIQPRSTDQAGIFQWGLESFVKEAQTLARFNHPAMAGVLRVVEANNTAYMVLNYIDGVPLSHKLADLKQPMTEIDIRRLIYPLLEGLELMHAEGILHRDISPDNIIVRPDGRGVLIDFGAARRAVADRSQALTGIVREGYSPPEQYASGDTRQGPWTDIYALGAVLYHIVTGNKPATSIHRMIEDVLVPARVVAGERYGDGLLSAIDQSLHLRQSERPQDIAGFRKLVSGHASQPARAGPVTAPPVASLTDAPTRSFETLAGDGGQPRGTPVPAHGRADPGHTAPFPPRPQPTQGEVANLQSGRRTATIWLPFSQLMGAYSGRINRGKIWLGLLLLYLCALVGLVAAGGLGFAAGELSDSGADSKPGPVTIIGLVIVGIAYVYCYFALLVKRAHDRGRSGWFSLVMLVPLVNIWGFVELFCLPGDPGMNPYGANPLDPTRP